MTRFVGNVIGLGTAMVLFGAVAFAADDDKVIFPAGDSSGAAATSQVTAGGSFSNITLVVGVVLAAVGGWFVWRGRLATPLGRETRQLAISETRSLGNRQYLVVASYENKKFLLGVCPGRIDLIAPLHDAPATEKPRS